MTATDPIDPSAIDDTARDRVVVAGPDAASYLQSQLAQDIGDQTVGEARWTLVLAPNGKVDALARITRRDESSFVLDTDAGFGDGLAARLRRFMIRVDAEIDVEPADRSEPADDAEVARVAAGWPRTGHEIEPGETIPAVTGVVPFAVSFTKGCYPGQELVERMDSRGADAPRSVRIVEIGDGAAVGDAVLDGGGAEVGTITSVAPAGGLALAIVKRGADVGEAPRHLR